MKGRKHDERKTVNSEDKIVRRGLKEYRQFVKGCFSPAEYKWVDEEIQRMMAPGYASYTRSGTQRGLDRQHKHSVKKRIRKAMGTLFLASELVPAFGVDEWLEMLPAGLLNEVVYISTLTGGYSYAMSYADAISRGLNDLLDKEAKGAYKAQVGVSIVPLPEGIRETQNRLTKRVRELLLQEMGEGERTMAPEAHQSQKPV